MALQTIVKTRYLIPQVIQTSATDAGTAALKAMFAGFGIGLSYERLREACQSGTQDTGLDALAGVARQAGMSATLSTFAPELLSFNTKVTLPAIVAIRLPDGDVQMVVLWRTHGPLFQVMDPAAGRIWVPRDRFLQSLDIQERLIPAPIWEEFLNSTAFTSSLQTRMRKLRVEADIWSDRSHQDAALRLGATLHAAGQLRRGAEAREFLAVCAAHRDEIPEEFWQLSPKAAPDGHVRVRGATFLTAGAAPGDINASAAQASAEEIRTEAATHAWQPVREALRESRWLLPTATAVAMCAAAFGTVVEALLFRGLFDMGRHLQSTATRLGLVTVLLLFLALLLAIDWPAVLSSLRTRFMLKVPRLRDCYFQSRLISDMAFRAHWLQLLRQLPETAGNCLHYGASLVITGAAIALVYPGSALLAALAVIAACGVPMLFMPAMNERDLRFREISAALASSHLDCLMGAHAIQAHSAQPALGAIQSSQLRQWAVAGLRQQALFVCADVAQLTLTLTFVVALVYQQARIANGPAGLLLLIYWATSIPMLGQEFSKLARGIPAMRNTSLRFLEMMRSPQAGPSEATAPASQRQHRPVSMSRPRGVSIDMDHVSVLAGGNRILDQVTLRVRPGEHIGIVGVSGAGKSSLLGCLLGWHQPSSGLIRVDDMLLDQALLQRLRSETAWLDPQVHLFRSTLIENLWYGNGKQSVARTGDAINVTGLDQLLQRSPRGLQTLIGEGGTLISGGEGQRLRAGRALGRKEIRLAILDEPARGLEREERRRLLNTMRQQFSHATLFCITHDVSDTLDFDRVLVVEGGRVLEQGPPQSLREIPGSRYGALLQGERAAGRTVWAHPAWRRLRLHAGTLGEDRHCDEVRAG
jgi:ATP-binding cassette subfamily B protein